jgi:hypothetical protein
MDPHLENPAYWSGFHTRFIVALAGGIVRALPKGYIADVEQYVWLEDDEEDREPFAVPDVFVATGGKGKGDGTAVLKPTKPRTEVTLPKPPKRTGRKYVKIVDQPGNRVVTVIEVLSPANKDPGDERDAYLFKRREYLAAGTNLVEIDLLRGGDRMPFGKPKPPDADFYCLVCRANRLGKAHVWTFTVRDEMPVLPIPLKPADGEIALSLRECLDRTYDDAGYANRIDYAQPPAYPLRAPDAEWAAKHLSAPR